MRLGISRPLLILPTYRATERTLEFCDDNFGKEHHGNSRANAVRHALWNYLICESCFEQGISKEEAAAWAEKLTSLHEELAPNSEIERKMDLHNNAVGRKLFLKDSTGDIFEILLKMAENSRAVKGISGINSKVEGLVHIEKT
ncbi:hypothetical protein MKO06_05600 [Gramella sp. GC03-9]|uniref:DUF6973 domain-containing protein n=1 Tax=Christiangramia oceanisediminis TaxID=2920386 RepID=A0A9X2I8G0_9FLAO|nr:hypothetical protein [Gramella oceanisediminis]MCP9199371.1 hypothetical protein [Gramella oceanisediminis]